MPAHLRTPNTLRVALCAAAVAVLLVAGFVSPSAAHADATFAVSGRGWGHGIGMTQYGAMGYANQGKTYDWILAHYFQHTTLATRSELTVKVDLDAAKAARSSWRIAAASSSATLTVSDYANGAHSVEVTRGTTVWITFSGGGAVLRKDRYDSAAKKHVAGSVVATFPGSAVASTGPAKDSKVRILGTSGPFSQSNIAWRGQIRFTPVTTTGHAIDYVPMEQYLRGVVPRESPSSWPVEALRAQAVAARSYAYDAASSGSVLWCTTMSQVYNGADDGSSSHESAKTDAAVLATADKFVVYGSKVVQAFFSSSSGGRTANIEDVWLGSSPQPYYTSVADADDVGGNPNYRWSLSSMSGATLGAKIRDYDNGSSNKDALDYSAKSPATLASVTLDAGSSGFVRHVTLKWSTGASFTITGSTFRTILGLKSTAFTVKVTNPLPLPTRFQETDVRPLWAGTWSVVKAASGSGGSYRRSNAAGATWTVMFKGTAVTWIGTKTDHAGKAEVSLDGTRVATVDLYSSATKYKVALWTKTGMSAAATHTLTVRVLGTHAKASAGSYVYADAVDVTGSLLKVPLPPVWKRYEQGVSAATYKGTWKTSALAGMSGGTHTYSREASATAVFTFTGTRVRWIGKRAKNYGKAWVSVDSGAPVLIDLYAATTATQQRLFESAVLAAGKHTLKIRVAGTKNAKATNHYVDVDAFEALQPAN